jgi:hypothetical protein
MTRPTLWFVVPAHGRHNLAAICLRQLRRTCDRLTDAGVEATAVVIADDENLDIARDLGFGTVERNNQFLSRKYNDGIQLALDPEFNQRPADYVVPCGSDDFVHDSLFHVLPSSNAMIGFQQMCFVREDGREIVARRIDYPGGCGIRIYPRQVMAKLGYRPADEDRAHGCDTSILYNLQRANPTLRVINSSPEPWKIVDWKSPSEQVTPYAEVGGRHPTLWTKDPFEALDGLYPDDTLDAMTWHYAQVMV